MLISTDELKDDALVFNPAEVGGGVREEVEKGLNKDTAQKSP